MEVYNVQYGRRNRSSEEAWFVCLRLYKALTAVGRPSKDSNKKLYRGGEQSKEPIKNRWKFLKRVDHKAQSQNAKTGGTGFQLRVMCCRI